MNTLNQSDRYLLLIYYSISSLIGFGFEGLNKSSFPESLFNTFSYVIVSLGLFMFLIKVLFPRYLPQGKFVPLFIGVLISFILFGLLEMCLTGIYPYITSGTYQVFDKPIRYIIATALVNSFFGVAFLLVLYIGKRYFETQLTLKSEEQRIKEIEFQALKSQVDPHFLFNNLNSIESLIEDEPQKAILYVQKLSKLYRYFLNTSKEEVVDVEEELAFARDYIYLLRERFGDLYQFEFNIDAKTSGKLIPPAALQTVIENVIKHNYANDKKKILSSITMSNSEIVVQNRKNLKSSSINNFGGTGLRNLKDRYLLLGDYAIEVKEDKENYTISLPLINEIQ